MELGSYDFAITRDEWPEFKDSQIINKLWDWFHSQTDNGLYWCIDSQTNQTASTVVTRWFTARLVLLSVGFGTVCSVLRALYAVE